MSDWEKLREWIIENYDLRDRSPIRVPNYVSQDMDLTKPETKGLVGRDEFINDGKHWHKMVIKRREVTAVSRDDVVVAHILVDGNRVWFHDLTDMVSKTAKGRWHVIMGASCVYFENEKDMIAAKMLFL